MAGASMNDIKARMKSVTGTMQITKAMELVATSKLRHAKVAAETSLPYMRVLFDAISNVSRSSEISSTLWNEERTDGGELYIVIAGDRGLAGGYNSNIFKLAARTSADTDAVFLPIGKKAKEYYRRRNAELFGYELDSVWDVSVGDCLTVAREIAEAFRSGKFKRIALVYTEFVSMMTQTPTVKELLPLPEIGEDGEASSLSPIYEGNPEEMIDKIVPLYLAGVLHSAIKSSVASECAARRTAMNSANKNAEEMINTLMLKYNRARQAVITQEITEIVSGAEAL